MTTNPASAPFTIHDQAALDAAPELISLPTLAQITGRTYSAIRQAAYRQRHGLRWPLALKVIQPKGEWGSLFVRKSELLELAAAESRPLSA